MDEVIFEEFKGTGNMELVLDRRIADRAHLSRDRHPSQRATRKEELSVDKEELNRVYLLRNFLADMPPDRGDGVPPRADVADEEEQGVLRHDESVGRGDSPGRPDSRRGLGRAAYRIALSDENPDHRVPARHAYRRAGKRFRMPEFLAHVTTHARSDWSSACR